MSETFDVVVVGARCAGASLAALLARQGLRVCVVDRARFPSDTPSTHAVQPVGTLALHRLGVLDRLLERTPRIEEACVVLDDATCRLSGATQRLGAPMVNARRQTLDALLVAAAEEAGVEVRTRTAVTGLVQRDGRVVGVRTEAGELLAPLVVGADGARSTVAGLVGAEEYCTTAPGRVFLWSYFEDVQQPGAPSSSTVWFGKRDDHGYLASPTDDGLFMAVVAVSSYREREVLADRAAAHTEGVRHWPELDALVSQGTRVGPVRAMSRWHGYFRRSAGPGWALVGDAGHFKDPTPGQGISDAFRQSEALAHAVLAGLDGTAPLDARLAEWWAWRDEDAWQMYWFAHDLGAAGVTPPLTREVQRGIAVDPARAEALFRVLNHDLSPSRLVSPGDGLRAAVRTLRRPATLRDAWHEVRAMAIDDVRRARLHRRQRRMHTSVSGR